MHIMDGVLSTPVMALTNVAGAAAVGGGIRAIDYERVPRVGVLASVFFLASFVHVNVGPSSVHLLMNGLVGLLLGWAAFPALAVALFLQSILFGFGGLTALGANILVMGLPAVLVGILFSQRCRNARSDGEAMAWGAAAGGLSVALTCVTAAVLLHFSDPRAYAAAIRILLLAHVPIVVIEGVVTGAAATFLRKAHPELLEAPVLPGRPAGNRVPAKDPSPIPGSPSSTPSAAAHEPEGRKPES